MSEQAIETEDEVTAFEEVTKAAETMEAVATETTEAAEEEVEIVRYIVKDWKRSATKEK